MRRSRPGPRRPRPASALAAALVLPWALLQGCAAAANPAPCACQPGGLSGPGVAAGTPDTGAPSGAETPTPGAAADLQALQASLVQVRVKVGERLQGGQLAELFEYGTGFFIDGRGTLVTAAHVLGLAREARDIAVMIGGRPVQARVLATDTAADLARLSVDVGPTRPLALARRAPRLGEPVMALGFPYRELFVDHAPVAASGVVASLGREVRSGGQTVGDLIVSDAFVADGCSGGPLVAADGTVLGVLRFNLARDGAWLGLSFAQPLPTPAGGVVP